MFRVRCAICRQHFSSLKNLKSHYVRNHSKIQIIKQVLKNNLCNTIPNVIKKSKKRRNEKCKTLYLNDNLLVRYSNDTIVVKDESNDDNWIELSFDTNQNIREQSCKPQDKSVNEKLTSFLHIEIKKNIEYFKSLDERTGEFYECHCRDNKPKNSSDTELELSIGRLFICAFCDSTYETVFELNEHEKMHQYYCKLCNQIFNIPNHKEHMKQHVVRIYVCHLCGFEFICKDVLIGHLGYHFEQQTLENILSMEEDYNMYGYCSTNFAAGDHHTNINNILFFLTYPYENYYTRNMFMKVTCDLCCQEFYMYDYDRHLKFAHFLR